MKDYSKVNAWVAERCKVDIFKKGKYLMLEVYNNPCYEWTILDPRCREIIRERFNINTWIAGGIWYATACTILPVHAETISEAEIKCIVAIYEAEHE